jgi:exonuclease III
MKGKWGKITIFNIYNDSSNNNTIKLLTSFTRQHQEEIEITDTGIAHIIWLGDFNRHHPYWDDPNNTRLFTNEALSAAERLIEAVADVNLEMVLLQGIPMHWHNVTKLWSRLDQVFLTTHSENILLSCNTVPDLQGIKTDHLPI